MIIDTFYDFTQSTDLQTDMAGKMSYSFGYWWLKGNVNQDSKSHSKVKTKTHYIVSSMRIERYYSSIREEASPLSDLAIELLDRQDYVSFFKACGPTYIRGIRRAQEVTAIFSFKSTSQETAQQYASNVQVSSGWWRWGKFKYGSTFQSKSKFSSMRKTLKITILGYGLGLSEEGSETLLATSLPEYQRAMIFAFNSMTKTPNAQYIGMVYGMEVVPWAENTMFQLASRLHDESIEIPLPRSMIPRAFSKSDRSDTSFDNRRREDFTCKESSYEIDMFGYCCEVDSLYDFESVEYNEENPSERVCRPLRVLDKAIVKENMSSNGEFVARLDRSVRNKMNQLNTLEKCISAARSIPERFDHHILKSQDTVKYDGVIDVAFSVFELKTAIDPFNDFSMVKHMAREIDEFMDMYYRPCLAALFGTHVGTTSDTDASYFMAYPWHTHDECTKLSCLGNSMRWDRKDGGCVPGLITGPQAQAYDDGDSFCSLNADSGLNECKYNTTQLGSFHRRTTNCWENALPVGRIDYFMEHFCLPDFTEETLSETEQAQMYDAYTNHCQESSY